MTRYADPRRCPDCLAAITRGAPACPHCGLPLRGETAQELYLALARADDLLVALRATPAPEVAPPPVAGPAPVAAPVPAPAPVRHRLSAASVPKILLTLGAACLLVAALVFLAVTWQVLGVAGRTLVLLAFTALAGVLTWWSATRGLRAAAEALGLVSLGLLTLDLVGGWHAGWFGEPATSDLVILLGVVLALAAAAATLAVRRTPAAGLVGAELVAAGGVALVAAGIAGREGPDAALGLVVAVLVAAGATAAAHRLRLRVFAAGAAVVTGTAWLFLSGAALERVGSHPSVGELWLHLQAWPLLVAAALVAAPAALRSLPAPVRLGAVSVGWALLGLAALGAVLDESPTPVALSVLAVLAATDAVTWLLPARWRLAGGLTLAVGGLGVTVLALQMGAAAVGRLGAAVASPWAGSAGTRLPAWSSGSLPAPWVLPLAVLVLGLTVLTVRRATLVLAGVASAAWVAGAARAVLDVRLGAAVAVSAAAATLALYPVPLWAPTAVLAVAAGWAAAVWLRSRDVAVLGLGAAALATGTAVALVAEPLTAALLAETLALAGLVRWRASSSEVRTGAGLVLAVALGAEVWTAGALVDAPGPWVALVALLVLAGGCLLPAAGAGVEAGAVAVALPVAAAGVLTAPRAAEATWAAVYLTVAGAAVVAMALLRADRRRLGWPGGGLLVLASWVQLADSGVSEPEAYTLPAAVALLVVGLVALRRAPRSSTVHALSAGLGLALVPSLLSVLAEPDRPRALLLGLTCFGLVVVGVRARWTAPLVWGAAVGLTEVLRLAAPYLDHAVPRWLLIGLAGAVLVAMGVTWERRLADARHLLGYVRSLR